MYSLLRVSLYFVPNPKDKFLIQAQIQEGGQGVEDPPLWKMGGQEFLLITPPPFSRYKLKVYCGFLTNAVSNWIWFFPILKIKFIMISALKHFIVLSTITATSKRNFLTFFSRNFTETKLYSIWNSFWHVLKMKCLRKLETYPDEMISNDKKLKKN